MIDFLFVFLCSALVPVLLLLQNLVIIQFCRTQKRKCRNVKEKQQYGNFSLFDYNGMFELILGFRKGDRGRAGPSYLSNN